MKLVVWFDTKHEVRALVTKAADNATIAAVEVKFGVGVTVIFEKASVGLHMCVAR